MCLSFWPSCIAPTSSVCSSQVVSLLLAVLWSGALMVSGVPAVLFTLVCLLHVSRPFGLGGKRPGFHDIGAQRRDSELCQLIVPQTAGPSVVTCLSFCSPLC